MTNDMIKDVMDGIADRARPVDGLAEQALRRAVRRRTAVGSVIAAGLAAAVAVPVVAVTQAGGDPVEKTRTVATESDPAAGEGLPADTAAGRAVVRECMPTDPRFPPERRPTGHRPLSVPTGPGYRARDFRLLASQPVKAGRIVLLGSSQGYRTCLLDRSGKASALDRLPHQTANFWSFPTGYGLANIKGPVSVQGLGGGATAYGAAPYMLAGVGLVRPQVTKVTVRYGSGEPVTATISNGFFVGGVVVPFAKGTKLIERSVDVTAYDRTGKIVFTYHQPGVPADARG
ncbi:hypothetical protein [Actinoallomurus sp. NPDC052274]|uniref:hypothetical protein n=1 Tax=Actinoallomurus sp. NPDC052274 TaxID=3155420 RepID=UPI003443230B